MRITILVVLYNINITKSKTLTSLNKIYLHDKFIFDNFDFLFYVNNENLYQSNLNLPFEYTFLKNNLNNGFAFPLNTALKKSKKNKFLLIFDENTIIPTIFFINYHAQLELMLSNQNSVAMVSKIFHNDYCFSPSKVYLGGLHRPVSDIYQGTINKEVFSILSGTTINISFMESINGFNELFWLDSLDRWLFASIFNNKKSVFISNLSLYHDLSILDYKNKISINRYTNILYSESILIYDKSFFYKLCYIFRLFKRILDFKKKGMHEYSKITQYLFSELVIGKRQNLIQKLTFFKNYKF